ncbi:hypothetical protein AVEN_180900-1 [Araneus ventricosus]|uniref:Uncharacterized protein n=1 Tax=Araneus ventricosus TaxID=182803 RepID=A0A4Y2LWH9_ARAVE|nr:hypothetical protein AVEN_100608-1 [Araneus ventricosus]GBN19178.1 hypothetical protein AVEN_180900-1 [Araneus ventricosus]
MRTNYTVRRQTGISKRIPNFDAKSHRILPIYHCCVRSAFCSPAVSSIPKNRNFVHVWKRTPLKNSPESEPQLLPSSFRNLISRPNRAPHPSPLLSHYFRRSLTHHLRHFPGKCPTPRTITGDRGRDQ